MSAVEMVPNKSHGFVRFLSEQEALWLVVT